MNAGDLRVLRELGKQVAEIAALPEQQETIRLWTANNDLRPVRPMVAIDQVPWHEMNVDDELTPRTEDPFGRELETGLRRTLYQWRHMRADMVVLPVVVVPKVIRSDGFGIDVAERTLAADADNEIVSHAYVDQLASTEDVARIRPPHVELDVEATAEREGWAREAFEGVLDVHMQGLLPSHELWDEVVELRGAETVLLDLVDRPEHLRDIADRWSAAHLAWLDRLEESGLLGHSQATIHCTGAFTDQLPAPGFVPDRPRARDLWTYGMAQIFGSVSRAMWEEFELPYAIRWYSRFGLGYYGCCDPLHDKIDLVRRIPNVRKISISPWADVALAAERIAGDFVLSRKPNPAQLAMNDLDLESVQADLRSAIDHAARTRTPIELILKDVSTVRYQPRRLWEWERVAMALVR